MEPPTNAALAVRDLPSASMSVPAAGSSTSVSVSLRLAKSMGSSAVPADDIGDAYDLPDDRGVILPCLTGVAGGGLGRGRLYGSRRTVVYCPPPDLPALR